MGQKKRKKNAGVGVDFKRVKSKVGRKLKKVNETKTDFKTKSINLPNQNINRNAETAAAAAETSTAVALTKRMVSMAELIGQSRHYNHKVRVNAAQGILEILQANDVNKTGTSLSLVLQCVLETLVDGSAKVRKVVLQVLKTLCKQQGDGASGSRKGKGGEEEQTNSRSSRMKPFVPLMLVHAFKAMTHLNHEVSFDGIEALCIMLTELRRDVCEQDDECFRRLIQNFNAILTQTFAETTNVEARSKHILKLVVCIEKSLDMFSLRSRHSGGQLKDGSSLEYSLYKGDRNKMLHRMFPEEYENFMSSTGEAVEGGTIRSEEVDLLANLRKLMNIFRVHCSGHGEEKKDRHIREYFYITCRVTSCLFLLLDSYKEFSPGDINSLLKEMSALFPVNQAESASTSKEEILQYNTSCVELMLACILYLTTALGEEEEKNQQDEQSFQSVIDSLWTFTSKQLKKMLAKHGTYSTASGESVLQLHTLISSIVKMLKLVKKERRILVTGNLCKTFTGSENLTFQKVVIQAAFQRDQTFLEYCGEDDKLKLLLFIPKMIWEAFKLKDKETCVLGSQALLSLLQCAEPLNTAKKQSLQLQLLPSFAIPTDKHTIWGPFVSLGRSFQSHMTGILHYVGQFSEKLVKSLTLCALHSDLKEELRSKVLYAVSFGVRRDSDLYLSFLSSLFLKSCHKKSDRADTISKHVCMSLKTSFADDKDALLLLGNFIMSNISTSNANVHLLATLVVIFDEIVREKDLASEEFARDLTDTITIPVVFVLLQFGKSLVVEQDAPNVPSFYLEAVWRIMKKAPFLVPALFGHLNSYMTDGALGLSNSVQLMKTDDGAMRSYIISTLLYEMIKESLVSGTTSRENLKACLDTLELYNAKIANYSKFMYIRDTFL